MNRRGGSGTDGAALRLSEVSTGVTRQATYADIEALPEHIVGEIIDGVLVTHPRPSPRHSVAAAALAGELIGHFQKGLHGPGGWIFFAEPELHLGENVVVPDLAGWRRERMPSFPDANYIETAPDWICEVLSASTERRDRGRKRALYGDYGVGYLWLLDPRFQILEAFASAETEWRLLGTWSSDDVVSAPPFDALSIHLADLWPLDRPLGFHEDPQHLFAGDR